MTWRLKELRLRRVGNSWGFIIPNEALEALGVEAKAGAKLALIRKPDGSGFQLRYVDGKVAKKLAVLRDTLKRYAGALRELAK